MEHVKFRAQRGPWGRGVEVYVGTADGKTRVKQVIFEKSPDAVFVPEPTFGLELDQAQTLMDDLWNCGLRPTEGTGRAGSLAATERHLKDLRTLLFKKEGIPS